MLTEYSKRLGVILK